MGTLTASDIIGTHTPLQNSNTDQPQPALEPQHLNDIKGLYATTHTQAVDFSFSSISNSTVQGSVPPILLLYFYPKDNTPGCTTQSLDLRNINALLTLKNILVIGVSRDDMKSHHKFAEKLGLPFALLADTEEMLCSQFNVVKDKNMYGKKVRGIQRSTFIYNRAGALEKTWRNVKAGDHIESVMAYIDALPQHSNT